MPGPQLKFAVWNLSVSLRESSGRMFPLSLLRKLPTKPPHAPPPPPFAPPPKPLGGGGFPDRSTSMSVTMSWQLFSILCIARATASSSSPSSSPSGPPGDPPTGMYRASSAAFASPSLTPKNVLISASLSAVAIMPKYSSLTSSLVIVQNS